MPDKSEEEKPRIKQIVEKYRKSISRLSEEGSPEEIVAVFKHAADYSNYLQRKIVGLEE
ncbi:hypothetical protein FC62_GL001057 [Amylolactobacillus amylotrophicus DSM 20534]|uniref:Uncharacterized protein n=2 Tax=Amylolactobacillus TaxID=2767876 RepID=A0A0R1YNH2_9LACO|nr:MULTISPECIES: hypothetical protein [Amylolactobacillus]KRK37727.1 hypothetical protein FC62_GL001057 [Amylolactobacillus amylotrophicus DSM 20534]KRM41515.1 hypothetical protein FD40_GL001354 [Amylolactobacillus amylophilus DSM 20533 = JCM 1125]GED80610.1 hypothetical protein LAM01_10830 [Amylolactobacillus amylophilus]